MSKKIKWGILGYAKIAIDSIIPALLKAQYSEFYGLASRDPEKLTACRTSFGLNKGYDSYQALLDDPEIDAVYIPLPNSLHKEWTIKAAQAGKHILCEKTIALNATECRQMITVCQQNKVKLMEAFMYRYTERTRQVQAIVASGVLGELKYINSCYRFHLTRPNDIRLLPELGGGAIFDVGCYPINFISMLLNDTPVSLQAEAEMVNGVDIICSAALRYANGVIANVNCGFNGFERVYSEIVGTKGFLEVPDTFLGNAGELTLKTASGIEKIPVPASDRYLLQMDGFATAIINNAEPILSTSETLRNMEIIDRLLEITWGKPR